VRRLQRRWRDQQRITNTVLRSLRTVKRASDSHLHVDFSTKIILHYITLTVQFSNFV